MPSSGTPSLSVTRNDLLTDAFRKMRVLAEGGTLSATQISDSVPRLNYIITNLSSRGLPLWTYESLEFSLVANQRVYTVGPGADFDCVRPLRLFDGCFIRDSTNAASPVDTPLREISRQEYMQFGSKFQIGIPNSIYYDSKIVDPADPLKTSPSSGWANLYVYTTLETGQARTLHLNVQRPLFVMTSSGDEYDLPQEWYLYLVYSLAADLADDYEVPEDRITRLEKRRDDLMNGLLDWSVETASTTFAPQTQMAWR